MEKQRRCLSLAKGCHRYLFQYYPGQEGELLAALVETAEHPDTEFDWFDAAVLFYQVGKGIGNSPRQAAAVSR